MIITVASQKGGTGKTTTASAIWAGLPDTLGIDLDIQGNLTVAAGIQEQEPESNIYDVLTKHRAAQDAIVNLPAGDLIPYAPKLATLNDTNLKGDVLAKALASVKTKYKHIVLDTPPALGSLTLNALCAADVLVISLQADLFSLKGLDQLADIITAVRDKANPNLKIGGLLLTRFNPRSIVRRDMQQLAEKFATKIGTRVFKTTIRECVAIPEAQTMGKDIFSYAPKSNAADDYRAFLDELKGVL